MPTHKHCPTCGAPLVKRAAEQASDFKKRRYCGYRCSVLARSDARREEKLARDAARAKACRECGASYVPLLRHDREMPYCSRGCSNRAKAKRDRKGYYQEDRGYVTPCWIFDGASGTNGYAKTSVDNRTVGWHRFMYEKHLGPIPAGLHLDHLCEVKVCGNPEHMEAVSLAENTRRSWRRGRHDAKRGPRG